MNTNALTFVASAFSAKPVGPIATISTPATRPAAGMDPENFSSQSYTSALDRAMPQARRALTSHLHAATLTATLPFLAGAGASVAPFLLSHATATMAAAGLFVCHGVVRTAFGVLESIFNAIMRNNSQEVGCADLLLSHGLNFMVWNYVAYQASHGNTSGYLPLLALGSGATAVFGPTAVWIAAEVSQDMRRSRENKRYIKEQEARRKIEEQTAFSRPDQMDNLKNLASPDIKVRNILSGHFQDNSRTDKMIQNLDTAQVQKLGRLCDELVVKISSKNSPQQSNEVILDVLKGLQFVIKNLSGEDCYQFAIKTSEHLISSDLSVRVAAILLHKTILATASAENRTRIGLEYMRILKIAHDKKSKNTSDMSYSHAVDAGTQLMGVLDATERLTFLSRLADSNIVDLNEFSRAIPQLAGLSGFAFGGIDAETLKTFLKKENKSLPADLLEYDQDTTPAIELEKILFPNVFDSSNKEIWKKESGFELKLKSLVEMNPDYLRSVVFGFLPGITEAQYQKDAREFAIRVIAEILTSDKIKGASSLKKTLIPTFEAMQATQTEYRNAQYVEDLLETLKKSA